MSKLLLMSIFGFVQCLAEDSYYWPYFVPTRFVEIFGLFVNIKQDDNRFLAIYTLSLLVKIIPQAKQNFLIFEEEVISIYIDILTNAVTSPDLTATKAFGSLVIPADDMLKLIKNLWFIKQNRFTIGPFLEFLMFPMNVCLEEGNEVQQTACLDLLWTLLSDSSIQSQVIFAPVVQLLNRLVQSGRLIDDGKNTCIGVMASCVLYKEDPTFVNDCLLLRVIKGAYAFKRYEDCIDWCNQILPPKASPDSSEKCLAMLYRGKAFYHLFEEDKVPFERDSHALSQKEYYKKLNDLYQKAGQAIKDLGLLLDTNSHSFLDDEMSLCLDASMISMACQTNGLKEHSRCLLCLKKARIFKSHLCPDAILEAFASGLHKTKNKRIFNLSFFKEGKMISPKGVIMWLFCEECELTLSKDGEQHFISKFFKCVYNTESTENSLESQNEITIDYGEWLYRFAIGFVFRGLINEAFSSFINSNKIHQVFTMLRKLICTKGSLTKMPNTPTIYLLVSPTVPSTSAGFIGHIYHAPFLFALTGINLNKGHSVIPRECEFFLAHIGILNFILPFDESVQKFLPSNSLIKIEGGDLVIPSEDIRASLIPRGIDKIMDDLAAETHKNLLESSVETMWQLRLTDSIPPPEEKSKTFKMYDSMKSDTGKLQEGFLTSYSLDSPQYIDLLPPGFEVDHSNHIVSLPDAHQIIFHGDFDIEMEGNEPFNVTFFLAAGNVPSSEIFTLKNPYIIFHRHQPGLRVTLGYFINLDTFSALTPLPNPNPKIMIHEVAEQMHVYALTKTLFPVLMERRGLKSYHTVVHRAFLQKSTISYDHVCSKRCWYCQLRCNTCLSPSSVSKTPSIRFCSQDCENIYFNDATLTEPTLLDLSNSLQPKHVLLLSFETMLPCSAVGGYSRANISVYVSNDDDPKNFPKGSLYIVYHHASVVDQHFLEYFIHEDCSFSHMLHYYKSADQYPDKKYEIGFIKHLLQEKLEELGIEKYEHLQNLF